MQQMLIIWNALYSATSWVDFYHNSQSMIAFEAGTCTHRISRLFIVWSMVNWVGIIQLLFQVNISW